MEVGKNEGAGQQGRGLALVVDEGGAARWVRGTPFGGLVGIPGKMIAVPTFRVSSLRILTPTPFDQNRSFLLFHPLPFGAATKTYSRLLCSVLSQKLLLVGMAGCECLLSGGEPDVSLLE